MRKDEGQRRKEEAAHSGAPAFGATPVVLAALGAASPTLAAFTGVSYAEREMVGRWLLLLTTQRKNNQQ
jgi:hypothetical protein